MTITLTSRPETEQALLTRARERGLTLNSYLEDLLRRHVAAADSSLSGPERARAFVAWTERFPETQLLSDEAVSRAAMYPDRD